MRGQIVRCDLCGSIQPEDEADMGIVKMPQSLAPPGTPLTPGTAAEAHVDFCAECELTLHVALVMAFEARRRGHVLQLHLSDGSTLEEQL